MILIYLFTKKSFNLFSINDLIQFHLCSNFQESYLHLILLKEFIKNNIYKKKKKLILFTKN